MFYSYDLNYTCKCFLADTQPPSLGRKLSEVGKVGNMLNIEAMQCGTGI